MDSPEIANGPEQAAGAESEASAPVQRIETGLDLPVVTVLVALIGAGFGFWAMTSYTEPPTYIIQELPPTAAPPPAQSAAAPPATAMPRSPSAEHFLNLSLELYRARKYDECIAAAREAIRLRPDYAEAWNNIAAASSDLGRWDDAINAATEAIRLKPDFNLAKNNLAWASSQAALRRK